MLISKCEDDDDDDDEEEEERKRKRRPTKMDNSTCFSFFLRQLLRSVTLSCDQKMSMDEM